MNKKFFRIILTIVISLGLLTPVAAQVTPPWDPFFASPTLVANLGSAYRPFGITVGDYYEDGYVDIVAGRTTGNIHFIKGNGDGTFQAAIQFGWKQAYYNAWAFAAADMNGDGFLDVVWGSNANSPSRSARRTWGR